METEVAALMEALRTGANRLNADLSLLEQNMGELYTAAGGTQDAPPPVAPAPRRVAEPAPAPVPVAQAAPVREPEPVPVAAAPQRAAAAVTPAAATNGFADDDGDEDGDVEGARLIALNMALNGQSREETDRYLAENFDLADRAGLLDEVYASVGG
jgi:hypothetical protein